MVWVPMQFIENQSPSGNRTESLDSCCRLLQLRPQISYSDSIAKSVDSIGLLTLLNEPLFTVSL